MSRFRYLLIFLAMLSSCVVIVIVSIFRDSIGSLPAMVSSLVLLSVGTYTTYKHYRKSKNIISGPVLVGASFVVTYPLSAVIYLVDIEAVPRGFFDLVRSGQTDHSVIYYSVLLMGLALLSLWFGMRNPHHRKDDYIAPIEVRAPPLIILGALFIIIGSIGTIRLFADAPSLLSELTTVSRNREVGGGVARYFFLSRWLQWGLAFFSVGILNSVKPSRNIFAYTAILISVVVILFNSFAWGGRSEGILGVLPLLFLITRSRPSGGRAIVRVAIPSLLIYVAYITVVRTETYAWEEGWLIDFVDWHAGRFSMIGVGIEMAVTYGYGLGSTLLDGLSNTINAPFILLNLSPLMPQPYGITNFVGMYLRGDPLVTSIVPGTICELYFNFGVIGVIVGYYLIGKFAAFCTEKIRRTSSIGTVAFMSYILVLICTAIIPGTTTTWIYIAATHGLPAIFLFLYDMMFKKGTVSYQRRILIRSGFPIR